MLKTFHPRLHNLKSSEINHSCSTTDKLAGVEQYTVGLSLCWEEICIYRIFWISKTHGSILGNTIFFKYSIFLKFISGNMKISISIAIIYQKRIKVFKFSKLSICDFKNVIVSSFQCFKMNSWPVRISRNPLQMIITDIHLPQRLAI